MKFFSQEPCYSFFETQINSAFKGVLISPYYWLIFSSEFLEIEKLFCLVAARCPDFKVIFIFTEDLLIALGKLEI